MQSGGLLEPPNEACRRLAVGAGATLSWRRAVGSEDRRIGCGDFGVPDRSQGRCAHSGLTAEREVGERLETAI